MGQLHSYKLELRTLPLGIQQFNYVVDDAFFSQREGSEIRGGNVDVKLEVDHRGDYFDLTFMLKGSITVGCDRCLDDMTLPVDTDYQVTLKYAEESNDVDDELIEVSERERDYDLTDLIYDTIALTVPMKHTHAEGQCNAAMVAELDKHSGASNGNSEEVTNDPRWEALRGLIDNNK